jgi:trafficking protein particle complex subunit 6
MSVQPTQVPLSLAALADPPTRMVDSCAMDYFLIEAVNALRASSAVASARAKKVEQEMIDAGLIPAPAPVLPPLNVRESTSGSLSGGRDSVGSISSSKGGLVPAKGAGGDDEEAVRARLESIGMHVGANFAER